jgi:hypothetical protein
MDVATSWGHTIRLNSLDRYRDIKRTMQEKLEALAPGLREKVRERRLASLSPEERAAWESDKSVDMMSQSEQAARGSAFRKLTVTDQDVAEEVPEDQRAAARSYAVQAGEASVYVERIESYRTQVNYEYWNTRCEVEADDTTAAARRYMRLADRAAEELKPETAREQYELAWDEWVKIFDEHPELVSDVMAEDLAEVIGRYKLVLDQLDEEFPDPFKLQMLVDEHANPDDPLNPLNRLEQSPQ